MEIKSKIIRWKLELLEQNLIFQSSERSWTIPKLKLKNQKYIQRLLTGGCDWLEWAKAN